MTAVRAGVVAIAVHAVVIVAIGAIQLEDELPTLTQQPIICIFPAWQVGFSRLSLLQGETRVNVERNLGAPRSVEAAPHECVRFAYGPQVGLTALFREGTLRHLWVTEAASVPEPCPARPVRNVPIDARAWYPASAVGDGTIGSRAVLLRR